MSGRRHRAGLVACALLVALTGCGRAGTATPPAHWVTPSAAPSAASRVDSCLPSAGAHRLAGTGPTAVLLGKGAKGVLLTPDQGRGICQWLSFGRLLVGRGYHVLIWDPGSDPVAEAGVLVDRLKAAGAKRVALMGAGAGADISIFLTAGGKPGIGGLVWLSGNETLAATGEPVEPKVKQLKVPVLFVASRADFNGAAVLAGRLHDLLPTAQQQKVLAIPGDQRGVALLTGPYRDRVLPILFDDLSHWTSTG
ncbi:MAG: hypothetical protein J2P15_03010 [Micromonosporaceae bacterium]|nr:hypothetical protein [Micromonosporaceae bacterium]